MEWLLGMATSFLGPVMPWLILAGTVVVGAVGGYISILRKKNAKLVEKNVILNNAHEQTLDSVVVTQKATEQYHEDAQAANKADVVQAEVKADQVKAADAIKGSDSSVLTQADIDAMKAARKKGK